MASFRPLNYFINIIRKESQKLYLYNVPNVSSGQPMVFLFMEVKVTVIYMMRLLTHMKVVLLQASKNNMEKLKTL